MLLWFILGIIAGIGISCLGACVIMNLLKNKRKKK